MAENAKAEKDNGSVLLFNRSKRIFDLGLDATKKPRRHLPGTTLLYSAEEAKRHSNYAELMDVSKLPGQVDAKKLQAENNKLSDENKRLKEQLLALSAPKDEPKAPKSDEPKKGK